MEEDESSVCQEEGMYFFCGYFQIVKAIINRLNSK